MNTKQKIDRVERLNGEIQRILLDNYLTKSDADWICKKVHEIAEIQEDLSMRMQMVFDSVLRVSGMKKTRGMAIDTQAIEYHCTTPRNVFIEVITLSGPTPKKLDDLLYDVFNYSFPAKWLDYDDDDLLDEAVSKYYRSKIKEHEQARAY